MSFIIVDQMLTELDLEEYRERFHNGHVNDEAMAVVITDQSFQHILMDMVPSPGDVIRIISAFKRLSIAFGGVGSTSNGGGSGRSSPAPAFSPIQIQAPATASTSGTAPTTAPAPAPAQASTSGTAPALIVAPTQAPASPPRDDSDAAESEGRIHTSNVSQEEAKAIAHKKPSQKRKKQTVHGG